MTEFTEEEVTIFDEHFAPQGFVLVRAMFEGTPRAVVGVMTTQEDGGEFIAPLAIIVTTDMFDTMDPGEGMELVTPPDTG